MKKYRVAIEETCAKEFAIVADSPATAIDAVAERYQEGLLALDPGELHSARASIIMPDNDAEWIEIYP